MSSANERIHRLEQHGDIVVMESSSRLIKNKQRRGGILLGEEGG